MPRDSFDPNTVPSPCFVIDEAAVERNLTRLRSVHERTGCSVLAALKAFAPHALFPMMREYLQGTCCSGPHEARLGAEMFGGETHVYAPAFKDDDMEELLGIANHITFNSFSQWRKFAPRIQAADRKIECGLRVNPEQSEAPVALYDPCAPGSRFGIRAKDLAGEDLTGLTGLHFHTLCEQYSDALERTIAAVEEKFAPFLDQAQWVNFGGGHWITRPDYDIDHLCSMVSKFQEKHNVRVYLEPGRLLQSTQAIWYLKWWTSSTTMARSRFLTLPPRLILQTFWKCLSLLRFRAARSIRMSCHGRCDWEG
ncbi:MAG: hypothetical protein R3F19_09375 [Verrucomicrobiales bacterium]